MLLSEINYSEVFAITDHESALKLQKFHEPKWRIQDSGSKTLKMLKNVERKLLM